MTNYKLVPEKEFLSCTGCVFHDSDGSCTSKEYELECTSDKIFVVDSNSTKVPKNHLHYYNDVEHLKYIDVYRVLKLFNVTDPCIQHAAKKLLVAGGRGHKDISKDIQDSIDSLERWKEMQKEDVS